MTSRWLFIGTACLMLASVPAWCKPSYPQRAPQVASVGQVAIPPHATQAYPYGSRHPRPYVNPPQIYLLYNGSPGQVQTVVGPVSPYQRRAVSPYPGRGGAR
ncbi:MAG: hypothetical protein ACYCW6_26910 [Candidatus Xenobia bacterium]